MELVSTYTYTNPNIEISGINYQIDESKLKSSLNKRKTILLVSDFNFSFAFTKNRTHI